jgi:hypothetical protein
VGPTVRTQFLLPSQGKKGREVALRRVGGAPPWPRSTSLPHPAAPGLRDPSPSSLQSWRGRGRLISSPPPLPAAPVGNLSLYKFFVFLFSPMRFDSFNLPMNLILDLFLINKSAVLDCVCNEFFFSLSDLK